MQYMNTCLKNATYTSTTAAVNLLDATNIYFEKLNTREIKEARFLCLYADEADSSSHMENSSMFLTYLSPNELKVKMTFFGIVKLRKYDTINIFLSCSLKENTLFSFSKKSPPKIV